MTPSWLASTGLSGLSLLALTTSTIAYPSDVLYKPAYSYSQERAQKLKDSSVYSYSKYEDEIEEPDEILLDSPNMTYESFLKIDQTNWF